MGNFRNVINPHTGKLQKVVTDTYITSIATSLSFKTGVATFNDLPIIDNSNNDARIVNDTHNLYIWNGIAWINQGNILNIGWSAIKNKPSFIGGYLT